MSKYFWRKLMGPPNVCKMTDKDVESPGSITSLSNLTAQQYSTNVIFGIKQMKYKNNSTVLVNYFTSNKTGLLYSDWSYNKVLQQESQKQYTFTTILPLAETQSQKIIIKLNTYYNTSSKILPQNQDYQIAKESPSVNKANIVSHAISAIKNIAVCLIDTLSSKLEVNVGFTLICKPMGLGLKLNTTVKRD